MIGGLSEDGMIEVDSPKRARHKWKDMLAQEINHCVGSGVCKHIVESKLSQGQFNVVSMCTKVFQRMQPLAETSQRLRKIFVLAFEEAVPTRVQSTMVNTAIETI